MILHSDTMPEVIPNSPIEFIITSSKSGGKKIIAISNDVSLRLIGTEALSNNAGKEYFNTRSFYNILFNEPVINRVEHTFYDNAPSTTETYFIGGEANTSEENYLYTDDRLITYSFVWQGRSNSRTKKQKILTEFQNRCLDISKAVNNQNEQALEWHVSAVVTLCDIENKKYERLRRLYWIAAICYVFLIAFSATITILNDKMHF